MSSNVIILTGPSGVGKTSIEENLSKHHGYLNLPLVTTRPKREGQFEDMYQFVTREDMLTMSNLHVYAALSSEWMYAVDIDKIKPSINYVTSIITNKSALRMRDVLLDEGHKVHIVYLDRDVKYRIQAMLDRGESDESINKRIMVELSDIYVDQLLPSIKLMNYNWEEDFASLIYSITGLEHA